MLCFSNKPVKDWDLFSELVEPPIDPQPQTSSDQELFSETNPQIIGDPEPSEFPIHCMFINIVLPYASVGNLTFKLKPNVEGVWKLRVPHARDSVRSFASKYLSSWLPIGGIWSRARGSNIVRKRGTISAEDRPTLSLKSL